MKLENIISVKAQSKPYILNGIKNKVHTLITIDTKSFEKETQRVPFEICLVLDKSGSMCGLPLENSKKAIIQIINCLSDGDKIHLVEYDNVVNVVFENGTRKNAHILIEKVRNILTGGSTNLWGGVEKAYEILKKSTSSSRRIMLFSDGLVNHGLTNKSEICDNVADIHKDGADDIENKIQMGMALIVSLLGKNTILKLRGKNGATLTKVYGQKDANMLKGFSLGDLRENDTRSIVCELEIIPRDNELFLTYELSFEEMEHSNIIKIEGKLEIGITEDEKLVEEENETVEVHRTIAKAGEDDLRVIELVKLKKETQALDLKMKNISNLKKVEKYDKTGIVKNVRERCERVFKRLENYSKIKNDEDPRKQLLKKTIPKQLFFDSGDYSFGCSTRKVQDKMFAKQIKMKSTSSFTKPIVGKSLKKNNFKRNLLMKKTLPKQQFFDSGDYSFGPKKE